MKIAFRPIQTVVAKIKSTEAFQRLNAARDRQDERMARWVEKKLRPRPTAQQIDPPIPDCAPPLPLSQIRQLLSSVANPKGGVKNIEESGGGNGENNVDPTLCLTSFAGQLLTRLCEMNETQIATHFNSRLMNYELQTLQGIAKGVHRASIHEAGESTAAAMAADIHAKTQAILDEMGEAHIDVAYIGNDLHLAESKKLTKSKNDKGLTPSEQSKQEKSDRATAAKNRLKIFSDCAPLHSVGRDYIEAKVRDWKNREPGEDHVTLETDLHHACLNFRLEAIYCLKRMEDDPLINKYERATLDGLKENVAFTSSTINKLETDWEKPAQEPINDEISSNSNKSIREKSFCRESLSDSCGLSWRSVEMSNSDNLEDLSSSSGERSLV